MMTLRNDFKEVKVLTGMLMSKLKRLNEVVDTMKRKKTERLLFGPGDFAGQNLRLYRSIILGNERLG